MGIDSGHARILDPDLFTVQREFLKQPIVLCL
jgi:hypothetical protein